MIAVIAGFGRGGAESYVYNKWSVNVKAVISTSIKTIVQFQVRGAVRHLKYKIIILVIYLVIMYT